MKNAGNANANKSVGIKVYHKNAVGKESKIVSLITLEVELMNVEDVFVRM